MFMLKEVIGLMVLNDYTYYILIQDYFNVKIIVLGTNLYEQPILNHQKLLSMKKSRLIFISKIQCLVFLFIS